MSRTNSPCCTSKLILSGPRPSCSHRATADDHHAFHEDAKPGDLTAQFPTRSFNSSKKFWTSRSRS